MNKQQLREIVKQDNARRAARKIMEDATLGLSMIEDALSDRSKIAANTKPGSFVNPCLVRGIGTVNPPMPTRASRNQWEKQEKYAQHPQGVAPGTEDTSKVPTVLVTYADGSSVVKPVSAFRTTRGTRNTPKIRKSATIAETALHSPALRHDFTS